MVMITKVQKVMLSIYIYISIERLSIKIEEEDWSLMTICYEEMNLCRFGFGSATANHGIIEEDNLIIIKWLNSAIPIYGTIIYELLWRITIFRSL